MRLRTANVEVTALHKLHLGVGRTRVPPGPIPLVHTLARIEGLKLSVPCGCATTSIPKASGRRRHL